MVSYAWNGKSGDYLDPVQWTPAAVPLYGEDTTAVIASGSATLSDAEPNGITLVLGRNSAQPTLKLSNAALGPAMTLEVNAYASLDLDGYDTNYGSIVVEVPGGPGYAKLFAGTAGSGQFNQYGTVTVKDRAGFEFGGVMDNGGLINLAGGFLNFDNGVLTGTGTIEFSDASSAMNALAPVDQGQVFALGKGSLSVFHYATFRGTVANFSSSAASLSFGDLAFDTATYAQDSGAERLVLTKDGLVVGEVRLADTPDTQYAVTQSFGASTITPSQVYSDGSIPGLILEGVVTIRNAKPDNQAVVMAGRQSSSGNPGSTLVLDNAALGPNLRLTVASPTGAGFQEVGITVQGRDATYGEIDVTPSSGAVTSEDGNRLVVSIGAGAQLDQEGTIKVISPGPSAIIGSRLSVLGAGTLNNDGTIYVGLRSDADFDVGITGSGTVVVDGGSAFLGSVAGTQTIDFLSGTLYPSPSAGLAATIEDWNSSGKIVLTGGPTTPLIDAVDFSQTSASGGDLRLLSGGTEVGDLHLLGAYATSDFRVAPTGPSAVGITIVGLQPGLTQQ